MPWGALIVAGGTYLAGQQQAGAAEDAAGLGYDAAMAGVKEQEAARQQFQQNIAPYLTVGTGALGTLQALQAGDFGSFVEDPGRQFMLQQGLQGLDRTAAARGSLSGGGADADRIALASGLADQSYSDYYNRLYNLATMGQNAAVGAGSMGMQSASNIGNLLGQGAAAQGAGAIGSANAWSNAIGGLSGLAGQYFGGRQQPSYAGSYNTGSGPLTTVSTPTNQSVALTPDYGYYGG